MRRIPQPQPAYRVATGQMRWEERMPYPFNVTMEDIDNWALSGSLSLFPASMFNFFERFISTAGRRSLMSGWTGSLFGWRRAGLDPRRSATESNSPARSRRRARRAACLCPPAAPLESASTASTTGERAFQPLQHPRYCRCCHCCCCSVFSVLEKRHAQFFLGIFFGRGGGGGGRVAW